MPTALLSWMREFVPGRAVVVAGLAAAGLLAGVLYLPALLRPGTPVRHFRELPRGIAEDLERRGCNIVKGHNVISGNFDGTRGWAVLCQQGDVASLLIYRDGGRPVVFGTHGAGLGDDPEAARSIRIVGWDYVARHPPGLCSRAGSGRAQLRGDAAGMGSSLHCYLDGGWTRLSGAD